MKFNKIKYGILLFLSGLLLGVVRGNTQDTTQLQNRSIIKINPLQLINGEVRLLYEYGFDTHNSLEMGASYLGKNYLLNRLPFTPSYERRIGGKLLISFRRYFTLNNDKQNKLYLHPLLFYKYMYFRDYYACFIDCSDFVATTFDEIYRDLLSFQFQGGYKGSLYKNKILMDLFIGAGLRYKYISTSTKISSYNECQICPTIHFGFNIGYDFTK